MAEQPKAPEPERSRALVLLSGGMDSAACVHFYASCGYCVESMFFDYNQAAAFMEHQAAAAVAAHFGIPHKALRLDQVAKKRPGNVRGRNALLLLGGLLEWPRTNGVIVLGVHAGTPYADCAAPFVAAMQTVFDLYCDGRVSVGAPFLTWSKRDIWEYCRRVKVPLDLTYSCQAGGKKPCQHCDSCLDRKALDAL
jgi:7-cyano-7-deazaguanine synthase